MSEPCTAHLGGVRTRTQTHIHVHHGDQENVRKKCALSAFCSGLFD